MFKKIDVILHQQICTMGNVKVLKAEGKWYQIEIYIPTEEWGTPEMISMWANVNTCCSY